MKGLIWFLILFVLSLLQDCCCSFPFPYGSVLTTFLFYFYFCYDYFGLDFNLDFLACLIFIIHFVFFLFWYSHVFVDSEKATATALFAEPDGTIYLVANNENGTVRVLWSFSTGSQIYSAYHSTSTERFLFYEGGDWSLFMEDPYYKKLVICYFAFNHNAILFICVS